MRPRRLFDTELAGRLAGLRAGRARPRWSSSCSGCTLEKEHSAADWSTRPLPARLAALRGAGRRGAGRAARRCWRPSWPRRASWSGPRRSSPRVVAAPAAAAAGRPVAAHLRACTGSATRRALAVVRALWEARDAIARARDIAPGRVLPDSAIVAAALADPATTEDAARRCRSSPAGCSAPAAPTWLVGAIDEARRCRTPSCRCQPPARRAAAAAPVGRPRPGGRRPAGRGPGGAGRAVGEHSAAGGEPAVAGPGPPAGLGAAADAGRGGGRGRARRAAAPGRWQVGLTAAPLRSRWPPPPDTDGRRARRGSPPAGARVRRRPLRALVTDE